MKRNNGIIAFQFKITGELNDLREVVERVEKKLTEISQTIPQDFTIVGFASYLNNFYNGLEKIFKLVVKYVDDFELPSTDWHKNHTAKS